MKEELIGAVNNAWASIIMRTPFDASEEKLRAAHAEALEATIRITNPQKADRIKNHDGDEWIETLQQTVGTSFSFEEFRAEVRILGADSP